MIHSIVLYEDKQLTPYKVWLTPTVRNKINIIENFNSDNIDGLSQLYEYIENIKRYISYPVIAWDNTGRYHHFANGATHINEMGYNFIYLIKTSKFDQKPYVCITNISFDFDELGLVNPNEVCENKQYKTKTVCYIKESQLRSIIRETIRRILLTA